jgi:hypothetical protein
MTANKTPDFTESELWTLRQTLKERYGRDVSVDLGDAEIRLHPDDRTLAVRPVAVWRERGASFAIMKVDDNRFRAQFFYRGFQQYGTGQDEYDDFLKCVVTLLQVQSDHERNEALHPVNPGPVAKDSGTESDIDYQYWGD